jgi:hypothetical protein
MTVQELIEKLEKLPKDMECVIQYPQYWDGDTYYGPPNFEVDYEYNRVVI